MPCIHQHQLSHPHKHSTATHAICCHSHPVIMATAVSSYTHTHAHRVSCPAIPTLSHTHTACVTFPQPHRINHISPRILNTPICLRDSDTPRTLSLSTSPSDPGRHLHPTQKQPIASSPSTTCTRQASILPPTCILTVTHIICVTQTVVTTNHPQTLTSSCVLEAPTGLPAQNHLSSVPCSL